MAEKVTRIKNIQQTPDGTPFVYFDQTLCEVMGLKAKMSITVIFDIDRREISIRPTEMQA